MPVESPADRASFMSADEFATPALYTAPGGGVAVGPITVIYDRGQAKSRFVADGMKASTAERTAWISVDDVGAVARDGTLDVGTLDDDGELVVEETLTIAGQPVLDETGKFWLADLLLVD